MTESIIESKEPSIEIEWSVYAEHYDAMCDVNPSYESMLTLVHDKVSQLPVQHNARILDVGAGTGNLILRLAREFPSATFTHLDMDHGMNRWARKKYQDAGLANVTIEESPFLNWSAADGSYDLVLSTNALYAIHPHEAALEKIYRLLKPKSHMVLVDFGRKQNTNDWLWYITRNLVRTNGLKGAAKILKENWEAARQNRRTTAAQETGYYWVHDTQEFSDELLSAGFIVSEVDQCYRGYSDIAVCKTQPG